MKMNYVLLAGAILAAAIQAQAQTKIGGSGAPDSSAMLEVTGGTGNNKGILLPRISLTNVSTWGLSGSTPVAGMIVYNTNASVTGGSGAGPYYWNGTQWVKSANAQDWSLTGNAGTSPATNFIGTTDNQPLIMRTNNRQQVLLNTVGYLGLGTTTPDFKLDMVGSVDSTGAGADDIALGSYGTTVNPTFNFYAGHGVEGGPTNLTGGEQVGKIDFQGQIGNNFLSTSSITTTYQGNGTTNSSDLRFNTSGTEAMRIDSAGRIGINDATPRAPLSFASGTGSKIRLWDNGTDTLTYGFGISNSSLNYIIEGNNSAAHRFWAGGSNADGTELMRIQGNGNVGIGVASAAAKLDVNGTARINGSAGTAANIMGRNATGDISNVAIGAGLSLTGGTLAATVSTPGWELTGNAGTNSAVNYIGTTDAQPLVLRTNAIEQMRVSAAGNVGIGNNAPLSPLSFGSTTSPKISLYDGGSTTDYFGLGISTNMLNYHVMPNGVHAFFAGGKNGDGTELMRIQANGNVGIGTNNPGYTLQVAKADYGAYNGMAVTDNDGTNASTFTITPGYIGPNAVPGVTLDMSGAGQIAFSDPVQPAADNNYSNGTDNFRWSTVYGYNADFAGTARIAGSTGTPATIMGRDASGNVSNITLGSNLSLAGGVLSASGGGTAGWGLTGNAGTNPATNFIGTTDAQPLMFRTNNTNNMTLTTDGFLGLNTAVPTARLDVVNNSDAASDDIAIHRYANSTGAARLTFFAASGSEAAPGNAFNNQIMGTINWMARVAGSNQNLNAIRSIYRGNGSTSLSELRFLTSGLLALTIDPNQNVGVGNVGTPAQRLEVDGNVLAASYLTASDRRLKTDIIDMRQGTEELMKLRPVTYRMKADARKAIRFGFIAQELEEVMPEVVNKPCDDKHFYSVNYAELVPVLTKAIQEQQVQIEALQAENKELKESKLATAQLMERVKQMEQMLGIKEIEGSPKVAGK